MRTATLRLSDKFNSIRIAFFLLLLTMASVTYQDTCAQQPQETADWGGEFTVKLVPVPEGNYDESAVEQSLGYSLTDLESLLGEINDVIKLSQNVPIYFMHLPNGNAIASYTRGGTEEIFISYAFIVKIVERFSQNDDFDYDEYYPEFKRKIFPNVIHVLLHEIGHALIDVNDMPTFEVQEEVLADQLAFFIMSQLFDCEENDSEEEDCQVELVADHYLYRLDDSPRGSASTGQGEHPNATERARDYLCWMHGRWMFDELSSVAEFDDCKSEYDELMSDWDERLAPWWRD